MLLVNFCLHSNQQQVRHCCWLFEKYLILTFGHICIFSLHVCPKPDKFSCSVEVVSSQNATDPFQEKKFSVRNRTKSFRASSVIFLSKQVSYSSYLPCFFIVEQPLWVVGSCPEHVDVGGLFMQFSQYFFISADFIIGFDSKWESISVWLFVWN